MNDLQHPHRPNPTQALPDRACQMLVNTLTALLPRPLSDSPQALLDRDHAAFDKVAAMLPVNEIEADLAARCVVTAAQAEDVMRLAHQYDGGMRTFIKLSAQYVALQRASLAAHSHLLRVQAMRHKRESRTPAADA